jgi:two-component system nitrate/nitrite response regulator NarL
MRLVFEGRIDETMHTMNSSHGRPSANVASTSQVAPAITTPASPLRDAGRAPAQIRILIAGERSIFRDGLRKLIESEADLIVVAEAADGEQVLDAVTRFEPDVLLLDLVMPQLPGLEVLQRLRDGKAAVRAILLAGHIERTEVVRALELGARGILLKDSTTPLLFKSIRSVMAGEHWIARETVSDLVESLVQTQVSVRASGHGFGLTPRELQTLALVVRGQTNRDIAEQLHISSATVKHHLTSIFNKTGASNRLELALFAIHHGLIPPDGADGG